MYIKAPLNHASHLFTKRIQASCQHVSTCHIVFEIHYTTLWNCNHIVFIGYFIFIFKRKLNEYVLSFTIDEISELLHMQMAGIFTVPQ